MRAHSLFFCGLEIIQLLKTPALTPALAHTYPYSKCISALAMLSPLTLLASLRVWCAMVSDEES